MNVYHTIRSVVCFPVYFWIVWVGLVSFCAGVWAESPQIAVSERNKPEGYAAEVSDKQGNRIEVYGLHFGRYSNVQKRFADLLLNRECGNFIVPLKAIASISDITVTSDGHYQATIGFTEGKTIKSRFGQVNSRSLESVEGETVLGEYALSLKQVSEILFRHEQDTPFTKKSEWGETKGKLRLTTVCRSGESISLTSARVYCGYFNCIDTNNSDEEIEILLGELKNSVDLNKVTEITVSRTEYQYPVTLTTKTGEKISTVLIDDGYLGGYTPEGWFFYVKLKELKQIVVQ